MIDQTTNGKNVASLDLVEVVLVQCNSIDNQYQQKSKLLYTFSPNESYAYLQNIQLSNLVFTETCSTYNTDLDEIIIIFTDNNSKQLEKEDKVNLTLLINNSEWHVIL